MNAGAIGAKRAIFGSILEQRMKVNKDGWNVVTFQRRDVPTSRRPNVATPQRRDVGSTNLKVNKWQRRDASTSRRLNVATWQRRDVSASSVFSSLKAKKGAEFEALGIVRTRARKPEQH